MGQNKSRSIADIANRVSAEVIMQNMQNCSGSVSQNMSIGNEGLVWGSTYKQTASINLSCAANFQMNSDIAAKIATQIQHEASTKGVALLDVLKFNSSDVQTYIKNSVDVRIKNENVQNASLSIAQNMFGVQKGTVINSTYEQDANTFLEALMGSIATTGFGADIESKTSQKAVTESANPLDFIGDYFLYILIFIFVIIGSVVLLLFVDFD
jgi:hypothetical protein